MSQPIYIFYALISEDKTEGVKMHGPYIHSKPNANGNDDKYIFDKEDWNDERRFLSKFLREKYPQRLPILHYITMPYFKAGVTCDDCGFKIQLPPDFKGSHWRCNACSSINEINNYDSLKVGERQRCMVEAQDFFDKRFEQMAENYNICNQPKRKKK